MAQSFHKEKIPKTRFYQLSIGAGTFLAAPRPSYDSLVNKNLPVFQLSVGQRISEHFKIIVSAGFQPFSTQEYVMSDWQDQEIGSIKPVFNGQSYTIDVIPSFNLFSGYHHMSRSKVDFQLGLGLGYLFTYRTEKFFFNERYYEFNLIEHGLYIPVKSAILVKLAPALDLGLEGTFLYTFLDGNRESFHFKKDSDHFIRYTLLLRKYLR